MGLTVIQKIYDLNRELENVERFLENRETLHSIHSIAWFSPPLRGHDLLSFDLPADLIKDVLNEPLKEYAARLRTEIYDGLIKEMELYNKGKD